MVKVGVIGCGKIAITRHLPEYASNPDVEIAGVYAVSYTHLDVYKRQGRSSQPGSLCKRKWKIPNSGNYKQ